MMPTLEPVRLNHYRTQSLEDYLVKLGKGIVQGSLLAKQAASPFYLVNRNEARDSSGLLMLSILKEAHRKFDLDTSKHSFQSLDLFVSTNCSFFNSIAALVFNPFASFFSDCRRPDVRCALCIRCPWSLWRLLGASKKLLQVRGHLHLSVLTLPLSTWVLAAPTPPRDPLADLSK